MNILQDGPFVLDASKAASRYDMVVIIPVAPFTNMV